MVCGRGLLLVTGYDVVEIGNRVSDSYLDPFLHLSTRLAVIDLYAKCWHIELLLAFCVSQRGSLVSDD